MGAWRATVSALRLSSGIAEDVMRLEMATRELSDMLDVSPLRESLRLALAATWWGFDAD